MKRPKRYDELWRNTIWLDNDRERAVLEILLADQRMYDANQRYSDIARNELARLSKLTPSTQYREDSVDLLNSGIAATGAE